MSRAAVVTALLVALGQAAPAQTDVFALADRASVYVEAFQRNFGSVVAEERYEQRLRRALASNTTTVRRGGSGPMETTLVSDFLLVQIEGEGWVPFRDVFEKDGRPLRDREERLAAIFLSGDRDALEQARKVMNESARYNIGDVSRNINTPTLALMFLTTRHRHRFDFKLGRPDDSDEGFILEFVERTRPTFVSTTGGRDLPVSGRFLVRDDGTVLRSELDALDTGVEAHIVVTYEEDEEIGFFVPRRMEERYRRPRDPMEVYGLATYSRFRRFLVTTSEQLAR